jgi:hypothetical protein
MYLCSKAVLVRSFGLQLNLIPNYVLGVADPETYSDGQER